MLPTSSTHPPPPRMRCEACPGSENANPGSSNSRSNSNCNTKPPLAYKTSSASVGRNIGRRSLDAFSSIRRSLSGHRRVLNTTTNQAATPTLNLQVALTCASAGVSPVEPAKQKWYDSLRGKSSQIPTPSSPTSMSSTLKRSRFFRSAPAQPPPAPDLPPTVLEALRAPLPKLELASFQSELQRMSMFGEPDEKSVTGSDSMPNSRNKIPRKIRRENFMSNETEPKPLATAVSQFYAAVDAASSTVATQTGASETKDGIELHDASGPIAVRCPLSVRNPLGEDWRIKCDLYYKGTAWEPERKRSFGDASAALAHFALRHMLSENRDCSETLLWTREKREAHGKEPRIPQSFTVYPIVDGPRRLELYKRPGNIHWAIITFTNGPPIVKSTDADWEDERLMTAVRYITSMGYHVVVWSCYDDNSWRNDVKLAELEHRQLVEEEDILARKRSLYSPADHLERRERYQACMRHGLAGFSQEELTHLSELQMGNQQAEQLGWTLVEDAWEEDALQEDDSGVPDTRQKAQADQWLHLSPPESVMQGFLLHKEEIISDEGED